jgi:hypothetical protein
MKFDALLKGMTTDHDNFLRHCTDQAGRTNVASKHAIRGAGQFA